MTGVAKFCLVVLTAVGVGLLTPYLTSPIGWLAASMVLGLVAALPYLLSRPLRIAVAYVVASMLTPDIGLSGGTVGLPDVLGALALVVTLPKIANGERAPLYFFAPAAAALYSLPALVASDVGEAGSSALKALRILFAGAIGALVYMERPSRSNILSMIRTVVLSGGIAGLCALVLFVSGIPTPWPHAEQYLYIGSGVRLRGQGLIGEASSLANLLLFALTLTVVVGTKVTGRAMRYLIIAALIAGILVTFTRTAILSAILALLVASIVSKRPRLFPVLTMIGVCIVTVAEVPAIRQGLTFRVQQSLGEGADFSSGRFTNWSHILSLSYHPLTMLMGHGYKSLSALTISGNQIYGDNAFLTAFYETGLVGLVFIVATLYANGRWLLVVHPSDGLSDGLRKALFLWLFLEFLACLTGDVLSFSRTMGVWFAIAAGYYAYSSGQPPGSGSDEDLSSALDTLARS